MCDVLAGVLSLHLGCTVYGPSALGRNPAVPLWWVKSLRSRKELEYSQTLRTLYTIAANRVGVLQARFVSAISSAPAIRAIFSFCRAPALGAPALGAPALGAPALGAPALGAPALGAPALGAPALGAPALGAPALCLAACQTFSKFSLKLYFEGTTPPRFCISPAQVFWLATS